MCKSTNLYIFVWISNTILELNPTCTILASYHKHGRSSIVLLMYKDCERSGCDPLPQATLEAQQPNIQQQVWAFLEMYIKTYVTVCVRLWKKPSLPNSLEFLAQIIVVVTGSRIVIHSKCVQYSQQKELWHIYHNFQNNMLARIELLRQILMFDPFTCFLQYSL